MTEQSITITKEQLAALPLKSYEGPIILVTNAHDLASAINDFNSDTVVGLDIETPPAFRVGQVHKPSLVQIATKNKVYLFQLHLQDSLKYYKTIIDLLENNQVIKAGIGLADDFKKLRLRFDFQENNTIDLGTLARQKGIGQTGVRNLAGLLLGFRVGKSQNTSNWARVKLSPLQIRYAATDAWVCRELYLHFISNEPQCA